MTGGVRCLPTEHSLPPLRRAANLLAVQIHDTFQAFQHIAEQSDDEDIDSQSKGSDCDGSITAEMQPVKALDSNEEARRTAEKQGQLIQPVDERRSDGNH